MVSVKDCFVKALFYSLCMNICKIIFLTVGNGRKSSESPVLNYCVGHRSRFC